ncbi:hypothetical protein ANN_24106 [Periplaneta americana]|uniref:Uncharacterized protein n=1 Tax=Periplaneta americana TaxID=6978 RepID=A0ABQ8S2H7_PERAM|nr:hypothetical protein ANN_24106 [Periplaneta americana]
MTAHLAAVRFVPGRSLNGTRCRHGCPEIETLAHVLGFFEQGLLLRNSRHHLIRSKIAAALRNKDWIIEEEISCLAENESTRQVDILAYNADTKQGFIVDPTIGFEVGCHRKLLKDIPPEPRRLAVASFRLNTEHDILGKHLNRLVILPSASCILCHQQEDMDRQYLAKCPALKSSKEVDRYWEARAPTYCASSYDERVMERRRFFRRRGGIRCGLVDKASARRAENPGSNPGSGENFSPFHYSIILCIYV